MNLLNKYRKGNQNKMLGWMKLMCFLFVVQALTFSFNTWVQFQYFKRDFNVKIELKAHKTNLNTAGKCELMDLSGIGESTANKIIEGRRDKPYETVGEIYERGYIGSKVFNNIKNNLEI
ncbi:MAG: helix-hairpin-helix domain-containing protein [Cetobacterium sp.]